MGSTVTAFDADLAALDTGIALAQLILNKRPTPHILLLTANLEAINTIQKTGPHPGQPYSLSLKQTADTPLSLHCYFGGLALRQDHLF
jgi:hypothetical protein